jgi:hypothetical protein
MSSLETQGVVAMPPVAVEDGECTVSHITVQVGQNKTREVAQMLLKEVVLTEGSNTILFQKPDGTLGKIILVGGVIDFDAEEVLPKAGSKAPAKTQYCPQVYQVSKGDFTGFEVSDPNTGELMTTDLQFKMETVRWMNSRAKDNRVG